MLSAKERLAGKYALAIFEIAKERDQVKKTYNQMLKLQKALKENEDLKAFVDNPLVPKISKKEVVHKVFNKDVEPTLLNFMLLLVDKDRITLFDHICKEYKNINNEAEGIVEVKVTTARELEAAQEKKVANKVAKLLNKKVVLNKRIDPKIVGGIIIQVGDKLIDGSVSRRLKNMERALKSIDIREIGVTN